MIEIGQRTAPGKRVAEAEGPLADRHRTRTGPAGRRVEVIGTAAARKAVRARHLGPGAGAGSGGSLEGSAMHRTHVWCLLLACVVLTAAISQGEGEVHGLARGSPVVTPTAGQAGDQH